MTRELDDHAALQATAGVMGHDINNPQAVENFFNAPVHTAREVLQLVRGYHKAVTRPELYGAVVQLESAMKVLHDRIFLTQSELRFMASDNRAMQKHPSGLMLVTTGWPTGLGPEECQFMLGWMLSQVPEIVTYLKNRGLLAMEDHAALQLQPSFWFNSLSVDPTTVPQGQWWSAMTMLTFKSWDIRSAFLRRYGDSSGTPLYTSETAPQAGRHIRVSPCAPQWQRKLEAPLRVLIAC